MGHCQFGQRGVNIGKPIFKIIYAWVISQYDGTRSLLLFDTKHD